MIIIIGPDPVRPYCLYYKTLCTFKLYRFHLYGTQYKCVIQSVVIIMQDYCTAKFQGISVIKCHRHTFEYCP